MPVTNDSLISRCDLGAEGIARVRSELTDASYRPLGELLLKRDLDEGAVWAFVPSDVPRDRLLQFEQSLGPYDPDIDLAPTIEDTLQKAMSTHGARAVLCMQTAGWNATDPWLENEPDARVFFCDEVLFEFARTGDPLLETLREGLWYPTCGMITRLPEPLSQLEPRDEVSRGQLAEMADAANLLIVGAWDAEQPVFWESQTTPT